MSFIREYNNFLYKLNNNGTKKIDLNLYTKSINSDKKYNYKIVTQKKRK
jgi:hypothetical protein